MFRKSVSFFILVALLWVLLWVYVPDASPDEFSFSDLFRGLLLVFSLMAFSFALLMLLIRYKGIDIISRFIPYSGTVMWLGKHAFEYSQPKTNLHCNYIGTNASIDAEVLIGKQSHQLQLSNNQPKSLQLGQVSENPVIIWINDNGVKNNFEIKIMQDIKLIGRNLEYDLIVSDREIQLNRRNN